MIKIAIQKKLNAAQGQMLLDVNFDIQDRQLITLYGKSGAGKTSILRIIAGLLDVDNGQIISNNISWLDTQNKIKLSPQKRNIGFVFQDYALFPNMTVFENLQFALAKNQDAKIIDELMSIMELGDLKDIKPTLLSGGQQQRVALARSLVQRPKLLLLDEPLSALDNTTREKLQNYVLYVHKNYQLTTILVSHDTSEILKMSDKVIHLNEGKIINQGTAKEILQNDGLINLKGIIIAIDDQNITLRIGDQRVIIGKDYCQTKNIKIGDQLEFSSSLVQTKIQKK